MTPEKWKKVLFIAKSVITDEMDDSGNYIGGFEEPIELKLNYQPVKADSSLREFGENKTSMYRAIVHQGTKEFDMFSELEEDTIVAYLNGASPKIKPKWYKGNSEMEESNGDWANYTVYSVRHSNLTKTIYFDKRRSVGVQ